MPTPKILHEELPSAFTNTVCGQTASRNTPQSYPQRLSGWGCCPWGSSRMAARLRQINKQKASARSIHLLKFPPVLQVSPNVADAGGVALFVYLLHMTKRRRAQLQLSRLIAWRG